MDMLQSMALGAHALAEEFGGKHARAYKAAGFTEAEWNLLTQNEMWTAAERRRVRSILKEAIDVSMTLAGMAAAPLPAHYVAAVVTKLVAPCNRLVAAQRTPEAYDAMAASGHKQPIAIEMVPQETMIALVMAYSSGVIDGVTVPIYGERADDEEKIAVQEAA